MNEIIKIIIWAVVVIIVIITFFLIFKKPISDKISEIRCFMYRGAKLEFDKDLKRAEKNIASRISDIKKVPKLRDPLYEAFLEMKPKVAIMDSWIGLESVVFKKGEELGIKNENIIKTSNYLVSKGLLSESDKKALEELRQLRNKAVHAPEAIFTYADALAYSTSAGTLALHIKGSN